MALLLMIASCKAPLVSKESAMKFSCPSPTPQMSTDGRLKLLIPKVELADHYSWTAKMAGLTDLRASALPAGDLEARVWVEWFGRGLGMVALRRDKGVWGAIQIRPTVWDRTENLIETYPEPSQGWDEFWDRLVAEGFLALPDYSCLKDYGEVLDGIYYFVEFNVDGLYRCYSYSNPDYQTSEHGSTNPESMAAAKHMTRIGCMIFNELCPETTK